MSDHQRQTVSCETSPRVAATLASALVTTVVQNGLQSEQNMAYIDRHLRSSSAAMQLIYCMHLDLAKRLREANHGKSEAASDRLRAALIVFPTSAALRRCLDVSMMPFTSEAAKNGNAPNEPASSMMPQARFLTIEAKDQPEVVLCTINDLESMAGKYPQTVGSLAANRSQYALLICTLLRASLIGAPNDQYDIYSCTRVTQSQLEALTVPTPDEVDNHRSKSKGPSPTGQDTTTVIAQQQPDQKHQEASSVAPSDKDRKVCAACGNAGSNKLKRCSRCKSRWYCSQDCQKTDWILHKTACVKVSDE